MIRRTNPLQRGTSHELHTVSPHDWSEHTKRVLDFVTPLSTAAVGGFAAITLNQVAVCVTIAAGLMSIAWYAVRLHDRFKYGRGGAE